MKRILGLDLGTNSIGWALVTTDGKGQPCRIERMGSRIIPMSQDIVGDFNKGSSISQTAERRKYRSARRLREKYLLRRERLHRVLNVLGFLPQHYANEIDFKVHLGKFLDNHEPKLAYQNQCFIFSKSFKEMLVDFNKNQPQLIANDKKVPYDWTLYYLRKKALTQKIEKEELSWILLNFNQKRGYYQREDAEDLNSDKREYLVELKVIKIEKGEVDKRNKKRSWYRIYLENGWEYSATFGNEPAWLNMTREFLITEDLDEFGNIKLIKDRQTDFNGTLKRKITPLPSFEEIDLMTKQEQDRIYKKIKVKTESVINHSGKTVGSYIYDTLLQRPHQKINGKLIRTIDRHYYKHELSSILIAQQQFHPELRDVDLYNDSVRELYRNNEFHQLLLSQKDFVHLFIDDIIFYQRPLRSKKSSIGKCSLETRMYTDEKGIKRTEYLRAIPKSHPLYQEFRLWQWLSNLKILKKENDQDVTMQFISNNVDKENVFDFLKGRTDIEQKTLLKFLLGQKGFKGKSFSSESEKLRWNYVENKPYPCNVTGTMIRTRLAKVENVPIDFLTSDMEILLWHIIYSVNDKTEFEKALKTFANKYNLDVKSFLNNFKNFPLFKSEYGSFSEKAIKKLLPLLRIGKYWTWDAIDVFTKERIGKILTGEFDEKIKNRVREKAINLINESDFQGLQLWLAQYIVYDRHSEGVSLEKWNSVTDMEKYIEEFKQHSLRNPIVEQVVTETLRIVKDIWCKFGNGEKDFFSEIHVELGRQMKNTAEDRKRLTNQISESEITNIRIKALIAELKENSDGKLFVEDVRPYSPSQQEALKIFEDGVLNSNIEIPEDILKISKTAQPSKSELQRYKLWLEQKYCSPYTGQMIPLNKLFTEAYQIEHIIPQSRYFDDSYSNKVICEASVNQKKDKQLGLEFIKNHHGEKIDTGFGSTVEIFSIEEYQDFVKRHYSNNRSKKAKLLLEEIPDKMIERQLNDTRYISVFISNLLSNIVRSSENDDGVNSKNFVPGNGKITSILRRDWGLDGVWNELILPRFERMNQLTDSKSFTSITTNDKVIPTVPLEFSKGFQKKRIDHRHHALDALVIACANREHINLLNNQYAKSKLRFDLTRKLRKFDKVSYKDPETGEIKSKDVPKEFIKPWEDFTKDAKTELEKIVVSFKQNLRIINKTTNKFERFVEKDGTKKKEIVRQTKGECWAIRKPLHKEIISGYIKLPEIKVPKGKILTATRKSIDTSFDVKAIKSITDSGIRKILLNYLSEKDNNPDLAFSAEGLEEMNNNIEKHNGGNKHKPIYKARIFELGNKFPLGQMGNRVTKFVEAAKGTNLFFAVYRDKSGKRSFETVPLYVVIERQKQGLSPVPEVNKQGDALLFHLSPNDLVYVPTNEELENVNGISFDDLTKEQVKRIFVVNDFSNTCYFTPNHIAKSIAPKEVDLHFDLKKKKLTGSFDTKTASFEGIQIKEVCVKLKIDRLGNITM